ncbi:1,4-dihydroxy-2-naphthoate octaprenyltransferase [Mesonia ostreae]|uniref:1,4-dihydroxy-2-naphthoate octaprenyltransferase n=1 Tax=Mesonia ostreae TaxID=861110 RepID=A0ABU2KL92_9FLAO|nr:1,4-dihydroxy-2-naphthoate octaprenyltransferase [Mesonia ostreae]MDT0295452.1 1,4-dihydroxy-2-naphthoate octaprenyltransferase [Mesonia ostreae]
MTKFKTWVSAARLRTLPLSIAGILVGTALARLEGHFSLSIFILALLTTLGLQVLSNFANDYGDGVKGTDNEDRIGPMRAIQSGIISHQEMKVGMILVSAFSLVMALLLIYTAFGSDKFLYSILFFLLGLASIAAAIKYTVGKSAYGYRGLGDVFVFIFFGLVGVLGSHFLYVHYFHFINLLPAVSIGLLSTAVLNLNNMRDQESDTKAQKNTLVVYMGAAKAKKYHYVLIILAFLGLVLFILHSKNYLLAVSLLGFIPLFIHLKTIAKNTSPVLLDPELKKVALSTFAIALLFLVLSLL